MPEMAPLLFVFQGKKVGTHRFKLGTKRIGMMSDLQSFRANKDEYFAHHRYSPLSLEQKATFTGLNYFPENPDLRIEVAVEVFPDQETIAMETTSGRPQSYRRYGHVRLLVDGTAVTLTIYAGEHGYFLPFVDSQSGVETYPGGRYLEPQPLGDGRFLIDFNMAYNPFCAYGDQWSCPLPPTENRLSVAIRAGEKMFQASGY